MLLSTATLQIYSPIFSIDRRSSELTQKLQFAIDIMTKTITGESNFSPEQRPRPRWSCRSRPCRGKSPASVAGRRRNWRPPYAACGLSGGSRRGYASPRRPTTATSAVSALASAVWLGFRRFQLGLDLFRCRCL
jgi:hypothetical protein